MVIQIITQMEAAGAQGAMMRMHRKFKALGDDSLAIFLYTKRDVYAGEDGVISLLNHPPRSIFDLFAILYRLFRVIRKNKGASVLCYTHYANVIGGFVGRLAGAKRVVVSHRNPVETYPVVARVIDNWLGRLGFYTYMICVSQTVLESFEQYSESYKRRLRVILNGVELSDPGGSGRFSSLKKPGVVNLVTTGRLHPQKNQKVLLEALEGVEGVHLFLAGDGELRAEYENFVESHNLSHRVTFLGELPPKDVPAFLKMGDVFVFPSKWEAFGFSVVEAMALGLPVIASNIPAMKEIVGCSGILLSADDVTEWSTVLCDLVDNQLDLEDLSQKSVLKSKSYDLDVMVSGYRSLLVS